MVPPYSTRTRVTTRHREAELKQMIAENSATLKVKEREVLDLQVTITEAKERVIREEERNS